MKKSIIALAVAGALTAPIVAQADATLYGSLRLKVVNADGGELNVADNASRVGIKGSVDTNIDGVKAIYQGEWKVTGDDDSGNEANLGAGRLAYVGLTGGFGTAAIGQQWTPYYNYTTGAADIMDGNSSAPTAETFRAANALAYVTPDLGGFSGAVAVLADDNGNGEDADVTNIAAKYSVAGFTVAASQMINNAADDADATAVAVSYSMDALYAALVYQNKEAAYGGDDSQTDLAGQELDQYELVGSYSFGDTKVLANYIDMDADATVYGLEVQHQLGKQARVFANYMGVNSEAEDVFGKADTVSAGLRVDF